MATLFKINKTDKTAHMNRNRQFVTLLSLCGLIFFSACNKLPETAGYIPSDATMVMGVNTREIGKKLAWDIITGSDIFKQMLAQSKTADSTSPLNGIDKAGIRFNSTSYIYSKADARFEGGNKYSIVVPLDDAGKWEAYIKRVLPSHPIKEQGDHKEMMLGSDGFAGWNKDVLVLINVIKRENKMPELDSNSTEQDFINMYANRYTMDTVQTLAELAAGLKNNKDNSLLKDKKFAAQQKESHDITIWVNYESMMNNMNTAGMDLSMARSLWKDNVLTGNIDFQDGKVAAEMKYYTSDEMKSAFKDFGKENVDKDMLDRIAAKNLDMVLGAHIALNSFKGLLDKMGFSALANQYLQETGLTIDNVMNALNGDIVMAVSDFAIKPVDAGNGENYKPEMNMVSAVKIGKKEDFNKLLAYLVKQGIITAAGPNTYIVGAPEAPSTVIMMDDKYVAFSDKKENVTAWLSGTNKGQKMSAAASDVVYNHPAGFFFDIKQLTAGLDKMPHSNYKDSVLFVESRKMFEHFSITADPFKEDHYTSRMELSFQNKGENSLLQLFDLGMKMQAANKKQEEIYAKEMDAATTGTPIDTVAMAPTTPNGQ